jgi:hypothetical protein
MRFFFDHPKGGSLVESKKERDELLKKRPELWEYKTKKSYFDSNNPANEGRDDTADFIPWTKEREKAFEKAKKERTSQYREGFDFARDFELPNITLRELLEKLME